MPKLPKPVVKAKILETVEESRKRHDALARDARIKRAQKVRAWANKIKKMP